MRSLSVFLLLSAFAWAEPKPPSLRVGESVRPTHYSAELTIDPAKTAFSGKMDIAVQIGEPVSVIWLNDSGLTVEKAELDAGGKTIAAKVLSGGEDFVGFELAEPAPSGAAHLKFTYFGEVNQKASAGIFRNKYGDDLYVFTQFEPIDARRAFPCFDEPQFKVPWQLTLRIPKEQSAFANTAAASEKVDADGMKTIRFAETKPLSSYLIAFGVGPIEVVDAGFAGKNKIPVRILTPRGERDQAQYAASVTAEILTRLENYFGIPYPYDKSDSVAIPLSFGGAMENPGFVTYDHSIILAKPGQDSPQRQRAYAGVAAHELAHQWFGDLVTMAWWNDTWLNEAFATWMSDRLIADWKPEWNTRVADQNSRLFAMRQDSLTTARRINQPAESKSDIANAFDGITYQKGGAVIRMFESYMGEAKFRQGVHDYLTEFKFRNARAEDFLAALGKAGGPDIAPAFASFLNQAGVPELTVALRCEKGAKPTLTLHQQRSLPVGSVGSVDQTWKVPVCVEYSAGGKTNRQCTLMTSADSEMALNSASCPDWVLPNSNETGYYRVKYQGDLLPRLLTKNRQNLSLAEQVGLLGDVQALTTSGTLPAADALSIVPSLKDDTHRQIVSAGIDILDSLTGPQLVPPDLKPNRVRFVQKMFGERARQLGWVAKTGESEDDRLLRPRLVSTVANAGDDAQLISQAKELSLRWLKDKSVVTTDVVGAMLGVAARNGDRELREQFLAAAKSAKDPREKQQLIGAISSFRGPELAQENFALLLSDTFDFRQSQALLYSAVQDSNTRRMPFEFVKAHFDELEAKMPSSVGSSFGAVLPRVGAGFCTEAERQELEAYFRPKIAKFTGGPRNLSQMLEAIHLCEARKNAQEKSVAEFLGRY